MKLELITVHIFGLELIMPYFFSRNFLLMELLMPHFFGGNFPHVGVMFPHYLLGELGISLPPRGVAGAVCI